MEILDYLTQQFHSGKQYSTINSYRSAISATHIGYGSTPAGQHPLVCRLLQGIFNSRPQSPAIYGFGTLTGFYRLHRVLTALWGSGFENPVQQNSHPIGIVQCRQIFRYPHIESPIQNIQTGRSIVCDSEFNQNKTLRPSSRSHLLKIWGEPQTMPRQMSESLWEQNRAS